MQKKLLHYIFLKLQIKFIIHLDFLKEWEGLEFDNET